MPDSRTFTIFISLPDDAAALGPGFLEKFIRAQAETGVQNILKSGEFLNITSKGVSE